MMDDSDYLRTGPYISPNLPIALRMDDVGASSKLFEVYSKKWKGLGNILFLKYLPFFKAWAPYRELTGSDWDEIIQLLQQSDAKLTVGITASWVEWSGAQTAFPQKFPSEAASLKKGMELGVLEIALHGLTHCQTRENKFRPRLFHGNRPSHREFLPELPYEWHFKNLQEGQKILQDYFGKKINLLIPPGNLFGDNTIKACQQLGITIINCRTENKILDHLEIIGNERVLAFHDKEIVEQGLSWLKKEIDKIKSKGNSFCFVSELRKQREKT